VEHAAGIAVEELSEQALCYWLPHVEHDLLARLDKQPISKSIALVKIERCIEESRSRLCEAGMRTYFPGGMERDIER
jgi:hypothetical protein